MVISIAWALAVALQAGGSRDSVATQRVVAEAVRFYRGDQTILNGFVRVPNGMLEGVALGPDGFAAFTMDVSVKDHAGTRLVHDGWSRRVPWSQTQVAGSATVEPIALALAAGDYTVTVVVKDSASGRQQTVDVPVAAYPARPGASDLLLAYGIRRGSGGDTVPAAGEIRKGDLFIAAGPDLRLTPTHASLAYYCEVYRDSAAAVPWLLRVMSEDGRVVVATKPATQPVAPGGGPISGSVDLTGLPPGPYRLGLVVGTGADTVVRTAPFTMGGFEVERDLVQAAEKATLPTDLWSRSTEPQLDTMFAPLVYLAASSDLQVYGTLTLEGKRRFLRDFWKQRDPTPGTEANEYQAAFYQRMAEANQRFREGGAGEVPGWRTDRGRVFITHGEPDEVLRRPANGGSLPWEAWKYTKGRPLKYVFLDRTRLGNYELIYTTDRRERSFPDWDSMLDPNAVEEINSF
ncbi:MAG TPA: GWxTD domain-containing protein [Gemmatimonadales bacterium]|nr:GWxTD domain-containing protein [Gemmatimonadales bacterium]